MGMRADLSPEKSPISCCGRQSVASRLYGPPRICKGGAVRASRFSCTLVSGLWRGNLGSRALMESAHASPHLPNGLEWAPARAQALGMPVRPVLPSTALFPRNCRRAHSRSDSRPSSGRVWSWFGARTGHAAMSTGCPRARAPQSPKRRWAGGGHRGLTTGPPSRTLPHLPCLRSPVSWPAYAG